MNKFLQHIKLHFPVTGAFEQDIMAAMVEVTKDKNEYLVREGKICHYMWFLEKGLVRCFYTRDGREVTTWFRDEGNFVVLLESFFHQKESLFFIEAIEDCELYAFHFTDIQSFIVKYPECRSIGEHIKRTYARMDILKIRSISMLAPKERYHYFEKHFLHLLGRLKLEYISSYLDLSKSSLARARRK